MSSKSSNRNKHLSQSNSASLLVPLNISTMTDDDDDFQIPLTQTKTKSSTSQLPPFKPSNSTVRPSKKPKHSVSAGKENLTPHLRSKSESGSAVLINHTVSRVSGSNLNYECNLSSIEDSRAGSDSNCFMVIEKEGFKLDEICSLDVIESSIDCNYTVEERSNNEDVVKADACLAHDENGGLKSEECYFENSIESKLMKSREGYGLDPLLDDEFEAGSQLDVLIKLCGEVDEEDMCKRNGFAYKDIDVLNDKDDVVCCPLCTCDISDLSDEQRLVHTNNCIDNEENLVHNDFPSNDDQQPQFPQDVGDEFPVQYPQKVVDCSPVFDWLQNLGLGRFMKDFVREEIDWETLLSLTEEDLFSIGVTALGPRKKIVHALEELRKGRSQTIEMHKDSQAHICNPRKHRTHIVKKHSDASEGIVGEISTSRENKLITDYFPGRVTDRKKICITPNERHHVEKSLAKPKFTASKDHAEHGKFKDIPPWCYIPGTSFRVDAFRYLRRDCSHWFLTHFHMDHYQGLTKSFCHGKIYCSSITARLVNMKIGIQWDKLEVLPLNQKINIAGVDIICFDANHCPGSIIILFEPANGKAVLHTGDFRFSDEMKSLRALQMYHIHTLILDTTYCNPQYDFPKQEAVIQFVIDAIQAETFNPKTLFLIGSYTIGKERIFLEVARVLRRKVYVTMAKHSILKCLGFSDEDMQWFTLNEQESHIHVVPMWTLASFKRLKHLSNQYADRCSLIIAFSPTGWTFGKGKKKSTTGRRLQQGTIIRYEVPYSEHCSFSELKEFVKFVSPTNIIPSVNNDGPESANAMISLLS